MTYINLDYRTDKLFHILHQLKNIDIPYFKTSGVLIDNYNDYPFQTYNDKFLNLEGNTKKYKGILGCFLAHKQAIINLIVKTKQHQDILSTSYSLILEDDVQINSQFWHFVNQLPVLKDADMIFFDSGQEHNLINFPMYCTDPVCYKNFYKSNPHFIGAHCYLIPNHKLYKILRFLQDVKEYKDVDGYYFDNKNFITYCFQSKYISINTNLESDRIQKEWFL